MKKFLRGLNPEQASAVETIDGPLLVLAGAGTGKTRVITVRMAHMLSIGIDPRSVLALVCPQGHPNPPSQPVCRTCLLALAGPARRVARPTLGVVRGAGVELELTGPVVIGRKPRRQPGGAEEPLLLPVAVPHVSGSHVELRIDGWAVLAADLDSTNGTFLRRRGEPTMRLSSTPTPLVDGDVLDLGHGVQLTVEGLP